MTKRKEFTDFTKWATAARAQGLNLHGAIKGSVAYISHNSPEGSCRGFWSYKTHRGWIQQETKDGVLRKL